MTGFNHLWPFGRIKAKDPAPAWSTLFALSVLLAASIVLWLGPVSAQTLSRMPPVQMDEADRILRTRNPTTPPGTSPASAVKSSAARPQALSTANPTLVGCASSSSQPIELVTLASSLKCDLDLIYEYVYDNIEYEPLFGSNKGALGTFLDQRGNDIDQAQLFVALLNAAGITQTSFVYGYITATGTTTPTSPCTATWIAPTPGWLGVKNDFFAIKNALANGGIPLGTGVYNSNDGTLTCLDVAHVWVQVAINGTNYVFDPSFKQHSVSTGLSNLASVLGYDRSQFVMDAGGAMDAVSVSGINRANIRSDLTSYANHLLSYIKTNDPALRLTDVIGGKSIIPLTGSPIRQTALPYLSTNQPAGWPQNWGSSVPDMYRTCLALSMPGVTSDATCAAATSQTVVLYSDQTYGQRITVFSTPDPGISGNYTPTLLLNGTPPSAGTTTGPSTPSGQQWAVYTNITHPYGTPFANQARALTVSAGGSYLVSAGWGRVGRGMVEKHRQLLNQAIATGASASSEPVLGEVLSVIGYNWLAENASQQALNDSIGHVTTQYHHGVGIIAQSAIQQSGSQGPHVDIPLNFFGISQQTCWPSTSCPINEPIISSFYTDLGISSSFESAVLIQTQAPTTNIVAASTIALVDMNAGHGAKTFFADGTTSSGQQNYINTIRPLLQQSGMSYSTADLATIDIAVTGSSPPSTSPSVTSSQVLAPVNGNISIGLWAGAGYTIITTTGTGVNESINITQEISGGLSGGFVGTPVPTSALASNTSATVATPPAATTVPAIINPQPSPSNPKIAEPVDAVTGAEVYAHTDLTIGSGTFPYALSFGRTYRSSSNTSDTGLGNGWTHNYDWAATTTSDPYEGMGASSAMRAAAAIAAIYVSQDLLSTIPSGSLPQAQSLTLAWIVNHWFTDQLTNNAALVAEPDTQEEFLVLPHADNAATLTYNPPLGSSVLLAGTGAGSGPPTSYNYTSKTGVALVFGASPAGAISSWSWPNGMKLGFGYNGSGQLTSVTNTLNRVLALTYSGTHIASVSDGNRLIGFGYTGSNLTSMSDPLGLKTTFAYDNQSHLAQVFYPSAPGNPFVTNTYDPLGRVVQQADANGQVSTYYFAGSRTELIDPAGDRQVTYQTPRGKVLTSAVVLSASYGDVFYDTIQQNGVVDVSHNQYDGLDRLTLATTPEARTTAIAYSLDVLNNIVSITQKPKPGSSLSPLVATIAYDSLYNKPTRMTDPLGLVSTMSYSPATGNLLTIVADSGGSGHFNATSRFTYNSLGQVLTAIDAVSTPTLNAYDGTGNLTASTRDYGGAGHLSQTTKLAYDTIGNVTSVTDPNGNTTRSTYDANRRLTSSTDPAAPSSLVTALTYDADGRVLQATQSANGALLRQVGAAYSLTGKVVKAIDANGYVTRSTYDAVDRLASVSDPLGRTMTFGYDTLSRKIAVSNLAIQSTPLAQFAYSPDGVLATLTDANSHVMIYAYDGFDRLGITTFPSGSTEVLGYDPDGNILSRQTRASQTIVYTYDTLNRLATKTAPSEATATYRYDLVGRLIAASDISTALTTPTTAGTMLSTSYSYDAMNRLLATSFSPVQAQAPSAAASTASFAFTYNGANQRLGQTSTDSSWWSYPPPTAATTTYTANSLNQYTAVGPITPTYDGNGNLTFDGTTTYAYDAESRLTTVSQGGTTVATYAYDAQSRRKSAAAGSTTTILVTDPDNRALLDYDGTSGQVQHWYALGSGPNDVLNQVNVAAGTRATLVPDGLGSIVASLDSSSGTLTKGGFQTYGEGSGVTASTVFGYTGARTIVGGLYDFRARFYSPALGRFVQADPIGTAGGVNLYAYVGNDPLNLLDVFGMSPDGPQNSANFKGFLGAIDPETGNTNAQSIQATITGLNLVNALGQASLCCLHIPGELFGLQIISSISRSLDTITAPIPEINFSILKFGEAAEHIYDAQAAGQPSILTIDRLGAAANRATATNGIPKVPGMQLDEYPPAMFSEGGKGASVRAISPANNMAAGAYLGNCCRPFPNGSRVQIKVVP